MGHKISERNLKIFSISANVWRLGEVSVGNLDEAAKPLLCDVAKRRSSLSRHTLCGQSEAMSAQRFWICDVYHSEAKVNMDKATDGSVVAYPVLCDVAYKFIQIQVLFLEYLIMIV